MPLLIVTMRNLLAVVIALRRHAAADISFRRNTGLPVAVPSLPRKSGIRPSPPIIVGAATILPSESMGPGKPTTIGSRGLTVPLMPLTYSDMIRKMPSHTSSADLAVRKFGMRHFCLWVRVVLDTAAQRCSTAQRRCVPPRSNKIAGTLIPCLLVYRFG